MAKLTDLPDELLDHIFREFLSKTLIKDDYLCKWELEDDAWSNRASLYRLSMTCRRLSNLALPLLFEQLFRQRDLKRFCLSAMENEELIRHLGHTRYLSIEIGDGEPTATIQTAMILLHIHTLTQLRHVQVCIGYHDLETINFLRELGTTPAGQCLKSMSLSFGRIVGHCTIFRDVSSYWSLTGLRIATSVYDELELDGQSIPCLDKLKELSLENFKGTTAATAALSLAAPALLQSLTLRLELDVDDNALSQILEPHHWNSLEHIHYKDDTYDAYGTLVLREARLPALRQLRLDFDGHTFSRGSIAVLPSGLLSFHAENLGCKGLVGMLRLIRKGKWLVPSIVRIRLDIRRRRHFGRNGRGYYIKDAVTTLAHEAILAAQASGVVLEPANLVEMLIGIEAWE